MINKPNKRAYEFGPFKLVPAERQLLKNGAPVKLSKKVFDLLLILCQRSGEVIGTDELMLLLWPEAHVEESNLTQSISVLRKALGDSASESRYIQNVPKYGYRFMAEVREVSENGNAPLAQNTLVTDNLSDESVSLASGEMSGREVNKAGYKGLIKRFGLVSVLLISISILIALITFRWYTQTTPRLAQALFKQTKMTRLTTGGNNPTAVISPDGKYMAHVVNANGKQSLWVRVIANSSDLQILAPDDAVYSSLAFSPDSQMIYYDKTRDFGSGGGIYQLPLLGGVEKKLLGGTSGPPVSFSPDGKSFAFVRWNADAGTDDVWTAKTDGTEARKLASRKLEGSGDTCSPSWSPDGKLIICPWGIAADDSMNLFGIRVEDGTVTPLLTEKWNEIGDAIWLVDGSGLVLSAKEGGSDLFQIWLVPYPKGQTRRITNDVNNYRSLSLTSDSYTIAAVQSDRQSNIWIAPAGRASGAKQVTFKNYDADNDQGLSWTPEGRIVYATRANDKSEIWITDQEGNQRQLTDDSSSNYMPAVTPDGHYIIFVSTRGGVMSHLWKMEIDGSNAKQLTNGPIEFLPQVSPDGKWVVYHSYTAGTATLWRMPIDGGEPVLLSDKVLDTYSSVSPDGEFISCLYLDEHDGKKDWKIAIVPFQGGPPVKLFDVRPFPISFAPLPWTSDGKALMYLEKKNGVSNIMQLTIETGESRQMTNFTSDRIFYFGSSMDGKQLAISRGKVNQDVVLIHDVR
jgi:Tol biopolymer transport system component/DNA-binding winged helix-turn-helix (wHTH) protein